MVRQLEAVRSRLAQAILSTSEVARPATGGQATLVESLGRQGRELAARVSQSRGITLPDDPWITAPVVQRVLPRNSVLVEIAHFRIFDFHHGNEANWWRPPRYGA